MDDLLREFLTETNENLERVDAEIVRFEHESNNSEILGTFFASSIPSRGPVDFSDFPGSRRWPTRPKL